MSKREDVHEIKSILFQQSPAELVIYHLTPISIRIEVLLHYSHRKSKACCQLGKKNRLYSKTGQMFPCKRQEDYPEKVELDFDV